MVACPHALASAAGVDALRALEGMGHVLRRWPEWRELAGHAHGITIDSASGMRIDGSGPRSDGAAVGF